MGLNRLMLGTYLGRIDYGVGDLRTDVLAGIAAFGVALPTAMGYGIVSGLGPAAGMYGAFAAGLFAAIFGGTRGLLTGPAIVTSVTMSVVVAEYATSVAEAATIGILAGLIQLAFGMLKLGRFVAYVPASMISGFWSAFGILVISKQVLPALGASPVGGSLIDSAKTWPEALVQANPDAAVLTVLCMALALLWRGRMQRIAPAAFAVLVGGTLAGMLWFRTAPTIA